MIYIAIFSHYMYTSHYDIVVHSISQNYPMIIPSICGFPKNGVPLNHIFQNHFNRIFRLKPSICGTPMYGPYGLSYYLKPNRLQTIDIRLYHTGWWF